MGWVVFPMCALDRVQTKPHPPRTPLPLIHRPVHGRCQLGVMRTHLGRASRAKLPGLALLGLTESIGMVGGMVVSWLKRTQTHWQKSRPTNELKSPRKHRQAERDCKMTLWRSWAGPGQVAPAWAKLGKACPAWPGWAELGMWVSSPKLNPTWQCCHITTIPGLAVPLELFKSFVGLFVPNVFAVVPTNSLPRPDSNAFG